MRFFTHSGGAGQMRRLLASGALATLTLAALPGTPAHATAPRPHDPLVEIETFADRCFDVANISTEDGAPIIQYGCDGESHQHFRMRRLGGNRVAFQSFTGKCLDIQHGSPLDGAALIQHRCHGGPNQHFFLESASRGRVEIRTFAGKCLDVYRGSLSDDTPIIQFSCGNVANQRFLINNADEWSKEH
ncbi:RICIN domain-containing protein [Nonomuraea sp. NPDC002799]